ncbi:MAG: hypothetical protein ACD_24C00052G0003 [uncultured bacterium]|nr:MAG: hypothetical protein ACD_24C00052G0003 [uncultured bacterium]
MCSICQEIVRFGRDYLLNKMKKASSYNLGPLEQEVMECIWHTGKCAVSDVYDCLKQRKQIAYTTLMTIMTRLAEKGFLSRELVGKSYLYSPVESKNQTIKNIISKVMESVVDKFGFEAIAYFSEELEKFPKKK